MLNGKVYFEDKFSLATAQALQSWAEENLITPPTGGTAPNSLELIWDDMYGGNTHFTTATSKSQDQYNPTSPPVDIGDPTYRVPTANMWCETELEGLDVGCSETINQAVNTRIEMAGYQGWWKDASGNWHTMTANTRSGWQAPARSGLVSGLRGCSQQVFADARATMTGSEISDAIINPGRSGDVHSNGTHVFSKPQNYYRWHGWGNKTVFADEYNSCHGIVWQMYLRLVVDDDQLPDDRHLARYVAHTGSDRKEYNGDQLWDMGISRFKRVTNEWQPFNFCTGIMTFAELEANPPPFTSVPV